MIKRIDEQRLEEDTAYRAGYVSEFMGFGAEDIAAIHGAASHLAPLVPVLVNAVYDKLFSYDATKRHFVPRQSGYEGSVPESMESLTQDHAMIEFRKAHLGRYLVALVTRNYDSKMIDYLDMVGKMHTPKAGSAELNVPLVQMNALLGFVSDALVTVILSLGLDRPTEVRTLRAFNKLLWIQNDLITRHYQAANTAAEFVGAEAAEDLEGHGMRRNLTIHVAAAIALGCCAATVAPAQEFEQAPIRYSQSQPDNRVSRLIERVNSGETKLAHEEHFGYLRSLLQQLDVPVSSQMLVFSKTSLQRHRIAPRTPRALYFGDDAYIGFCQQGEVLEISAADPKLGTVFYTLDQDDDGVPNFRRQADNCLICHGSSQTKEIPGHLVRSVFSDASGLPTLSAGTYRVDHTTPLEKRWGGWYVSGTHGEQKHLGNLIVRERTNSETLDNSAGMNQTCLDGYFQTSHYLTGHSDIVALMVLEHQTDAHNYITRANFLTRQAMHYQEALNRELKEPADHVWDSTKSRIKNAGEPLVEYLLFSGEAQLTATIHGVSGFAEAFAQRGPRDSRGRSLRDFDLTKRLFKYPCSYVIYSPSFAALPREVKDYVLGRLREVLAGQDQTGKFMHLSAADRTAIREILEATLPDWPSGVLAR